MDLVRRLHHAIKKGDKPGIETAVAGGADMDQVWGMQGTALCQAITTGNCDIVALLLELSCDVNMADYDGGFPLSLAIRKHLPDIALLLMSVPSCDVNAMDPVSKQRPLCAAVTEGFSQVVEALVQDPRCNITQGNGVGNSALHLALLHGQDHIARILARCHGLRFLRNLAGHAPLHIAATLGQRRSLDILFPPSHATALASEGFFHSGAEDAAAGAGNPATASMRELSQKATFSGDTALHLAVREKHSEFAERLIELGAAADIQNNNGQTALLLACADGNLRLARLLLESGAPPSQPGHLRLQQQQRTLLATHARESSLTPLHVAASSDSNLELSRLLCERGADMNACDERGRSPLYLALLNGAGETAAYLLSRGEQRLCAPLGGSSMLHAVCQCPTKAAEITSALLKVGCSPFTPNRQGNLPLHEALCWENVDVVRVLLEEGGMNPSVRGELGTLPLAFAARTGLVEMAALLLGAGAEINGADNPQDKDEEEEEEEEWTPLREALEAGAVDFARYLVSAGCNLSTEKYLFDSFKSQAPNSSSNNAFSLKDLDDSEDSSDDSEDDDSDEVPVVLRDNPELMEWFRVRASNPRPLFQLCLEAVRNVFRQGDPPFALMLALPLPHKFIAKLLYKEEI